nr:serine/threonine-protein kinase [Microbacterium endophyticum]
MPSAPPVIPGLVYVRPLGSGGFADVFLYAQDMPRRQVAVKVLPSDVRDPGLLRMFNSEADVLAHLSAHPSIVTVYQAGVSADGRPYIVMEYCPGSFAQRYRVERLPIADVLATGVRMASALESAHRAGLIHRDVKPSNILITTFGTPVLADFGIASSLALDPSDEVLAMSIPWSAPEVIAEDTAGTVSTEVWSLGATIYSLLAGHSPFERRDRGENSREQLKRRISRASYTPIARTDVPGALQDVLARAMSRNPDHRYGSAREVAEALRTVQAELALPMTPIEVATEEWAESGPTLDFSDGSLRGPVRTTIERESHRKPRSRTGMSSHVRDEDTDITAPGRRPTMRTAFPWLIAVGGLVLVVATAVTVLLIAGVL